MYRAREGESTARLHIAMEINRLDMSKRATSLV